MVKNLEIKMNRDGWYEAESPDIPGLYVANPILYSVLEDIPAVIKALEKENHVDT